jgi:uncharacterized protein YxjI
MLVSSFAAIVGTQTGGSMLLDRRQFLVKERVSALQLTDTYDLLDSETGETLGQARDEPPRWAKFARLLVKKHFLPTNLNFYEAGAARPVLALHKKPGFLRTTVLVSGSQSEPLGSFRSKAFSLGGGFHAFDNGGHQIAEIKGDWKVWNFRFLDTHGRELGTVTKKWAGLGKELLTSAETYRIALSDAASEGAHQTALLLAAGLAIDLVFKEHS